MKPLLTAILDTLQRLNKYTNHNIVSISSLKEEYDNLDDFDQLCNRIETELSKLDQASSYNRAETKESLSTLHTIIMNYYWHIDQPKIMIEKFIGKYRDCIDKKAVSNDNQ